jgi:hypothetical protein
MSEPTIMWTRVYVSKFKVKTLALAGEVSWDWEYFKFGSSNWTSSLVKEQELKYRQASKKRLAVYSR